MSTLLAIVQLLLVPVLLVIALAVRFAGAGRALNNVDYARVEDPQALHRWAGHRLLLLPPGFLATGLVSLRNPGLSVLLFLGMVCVLLVVAVWLMLGAERFQRRA